MACDAGVGPLDTAALLIFLYSCVAASLRNRPPAKRYTVLQWWSVSTGRQGQTLHNNTQATVKPDKRSVNTRDKFSKEVVLFLPAHV